MSCKYNNCKHCGYKSECEIYKENADLELKIKKLTQHLEPQAMTALFEQVEEEVKQGQKIKTHQTLGTIATDDGGNATLQFQIRLGKNKLNPLNWIAR